MSQRSPAALAPRTRPAASDPRTSVASVGGRSIARAFDILAALNRGGFATLESLRDETSLPKSTIHRILGTLVAEGYAVRDPVRAVYRLTGKVRLLSDGFAGVCEITDAAAPILQETTAAIGWPLGLGTLDGTEIVVRYSTMPFSRWAVRASTVGNRHSLLGSAMGNAYVAACGAQERETLLARLREGAGPAASLARDDDRVALILASTRAQGFGLRLGGPRDDSSTVSVAILVSARVAGVISMTAFRRSMTGRTIQRHLPILRDVAARIAARLGASACGAGEGRSEPPEITASGAKGVPPPATPDSAPWNRPASCETRRRARAQTEG